MHTCSAVHILRKRGSTHTIAGSNAIFDTITFISVNWQMGQCNGPKGKAGHVLVSSTIAKVVPSSGTTTRSMPGSTSPSETTMHTPENTRTSPLTAMASRFASFEAYKGWLADPQSRRQGRRACGRGPLPSRPFRASNHASRITDVVFLSHCEAQDCLHGVRGG